MNVIDSNIQTTNLSDASTTSEKASILPDVLWSIILDYMTEKRQELVAKAHPEIEKTLYKNRQATIAKMTKELNLVASWLNKNLDDPNQFSALRQASLSAKGLISDYDQIKAHYFTDKFILLGLFAENTKMQNCFSVQDPVPFSDFQLFQDKSHLTRALSKYEYANAIEFCSRRSRQDCVDLMNYFLVREMYEEVLETLVNYACHLKEPRPHFYDLLREPWPCIFDFLNDYLLTVDSNEAYKIIDRIIKLEPYQKNALNLLPAFEWLVSEENYIKAHSLFRTTWGNHKHIEYFTVIIKGLINDGKSYEALLWVGCLAFQKKTDRMNLLKSVIFGFLAENNIQQALKIFYSCEFSVAENTEFIRVLCRKYLDLGEPEKALKFVMKNIRSKRCIQYHLHEVEDEIYLRQVEKLIHERNMTEAQKVYSQTRFSKSIPRLNLLADASYVPCTDYIVAYSQDSQDDLRVYQKSWTMTTIQLGLLRLFLALKNTNFLKQLIPTLAVGEGFVEFEGVKFVINGENTTEVLELVNDFNNSKPKNRDNERQPFHNKDAMLKKIGHFLVHNSQADEALKVAESIGNNNDKTKAYLEIVSLLIKQNHIEQARKVAESIPREVKNLVEKKIADFLNPPTVTVAPIEILEGDIAPLPMEPIKISFKNVDNERTKETDSSKLKKPLQLDDFLNAPPAKLSDPKKLVDEIASLPVKSHKISIKNVDNERTKKTDDSKLKQPLTVHSETRFRDAPTLISTSQPIQSPQTKRFSYIRNTFNWVALKIMSFVTTLFAFIRSFVISIYSIPTRLISYR